MMSLSSVMKYKPRVQALGQASLEEQAKMYRDIILISRDIMEQQVGAPDYHQPSLGEDSRNS